MGIYRDATFRWQADPAIGGGSGPNLNQWRNQFGTGFHDRMERNVNGVLARLGTLVNGGVPGPIYPRTAPTLSPDTFSTASSFQNPNNSFGSSFPTQQTAFNSGFNTNFNRTPIGINNLNTVNSTPWNPNGGSNFNANFHNSWISDARNGLANNIFGQGQFFTPSFPTFSTASAFQNPNNFNFGANGAFGFTTI